MSSYLWRNVIPHLSDIGRCLAPDLIGMGDSKPSPLYTYRFIDHANYLDAWFESLSLTSEVILVIHDWGSALGFYRTHRLPEQVAGIVYMDAIVQPMTWEDLNTVAPIFKRIRTMPAGEEFCFNYNLFFEKVIPECVFREMDDAAMSRYRAPYKDPVSRLPTLIWARDVPMVEEPNYLNPIVGAYGKFLQTSDIPKLFVAGDPGTILWEGGVKKVFARSWANQREVTVKGKHFMQEDSQTRLTKQPEHSSRTFVRVTPR